jgi:epoxyqueuosine reductase QueG
LKLSAIWKDIERVSRERGVLHIGAGEIFDRHADVFSDWISRKGHASMSYLAKNVSIRNEPSNRFPWAKSVIAILVPYASERPEAPRDALSNHIARYALGDDYHEVLDDILRAIEA